MSSVFTMGSRPSAAIALSETACHFANGTTVALAPRVPGEAVWPALRDVLAEHAARSGGGSANRSLAIALLPSLAPLRIVRLPKMSHDDLVAVLTRSAHRYFPAVRDPQIVAAERVGEGEGAEHPYAVVSVSAHVLSVIQATVRQAGWTVSIIVPAYAAWIAAAAGKPGGRAVSGDTPVAVHREDGGYDVLTAHHGIPATLRRLRQGEAELPHGAIRLEMPGQDAARYAARTRVLELMTDDIRAQRHATRRKMQLLALAAVFVLAIGGMAAFALYQNRQAAQIASEREALREQVDSAAKLQAVLARLTTPATTLARIEEYGVRWSAVIAELSDNLPPDSYIEALRASNDSLALDAASGDGARAIQSVASSELLANVVPQGSIRRDDTGEGLERFTLTARVSNAARLVPVPERAGPRLRPGPAARSTSGTASNAAAGAAQ